MDMMNRSRVEDTSSKVQKCLSELGLKPYSSVEIMSFTSNLLESNKIGSGGYGEVYKGHLPSGILIAVKVLENMDIVEDTFIAEVRTMEKVVHRNLIKLYGYCFEDVMKALVFEYMENGSFDKILFENHHSDINWEKLYGIAIGTAKGLNYLHNDLDELIIHYDIKPGNVLLDKNLSAKIADFGLTKIVNRDVRCVDVSRIRGTLGYIAPEIWTTGLQVSSKCDVFSFGMMLFEILGKRRNGVEENWFPGIVWKQFKSGKLEQLIGDCGITEKDKKKAIILSKVALCCVHHRPERRPSMKEVVSMLEGHIPVEEPSYPFLPGQFSNSSMIPSQGVPQVFFEVPLARIERKWVDSSLERDPAYTSYASITGSGNNGPEDDGGVTLPQLESNVPKKLSRDMLEVDMATLVPNKGMKLPTTKLMGKTTALKYKEIILQLIAKAEAVIIGVHGMGGVGKTTIFKHVYNQLLAEGKCFDKIIWVTVSRDSNITKLQDDLAKELDLNLSHEDDVLRRSRLLFQALEREKRVVFFFDDMWKKISLDEIGIPEPTQENGFKLLLTTRLLDVSRRMGCHKDNIITVKGLPQDEAWELFMDKIDCVLSPQVEKIAEMVAKKCSGLPLAIITVGGAMRRNSDIDEWRVALNDLNLRNPSNRIMDMEDNVYKCLKFSYDRLENEKQRKCFLCCALYPEDWRIVTRELVDFWIMDGIVEGTNKQDELLEGQYILNKLKDHCLLESIYPFIDEYFEMSDAVKMHDSIREMALRLTNNCFLVKGRGLKELPNKEEWEIDLERASFMGNEIKNILISPICPKLSTLILHGGFLKILTHDFFVNMKGLKVLDLRWYHHLPLKVFPRGSLAWLFLESLPDSISDLVNLRALRLGGYKCLAILPSLAKLVLLRTLELNATDIEKLPEGMEMLVNLRCLNLHMVHLKERIPIGLISKLSSLRELYLNEIDVDKVYEIGRGESFVKELLSLKELENLSVAFHCMSDYASYVGSPEFNGLKCFYLTNWEGSCSMGLHPLGPPPRATINLYDEHVPLLFPQDTKRLEITSFQDVIKLNDLITENKKISATGSLRSLESLKIDRCAKLCTIFEGISGVLPVFCLKSLEIYCCQSLKNVFQSSTSLRLLQNLEDITIESCNELEELTGDEEEETETPISISRLKKLCIKDLPKLKRIWRGVIPVFCLKELIISDCHNLENVFPSSTLLQLLQNLEQITIKSCNELQELTGDEEEETETPILIPRLKILCIKDLPKLKRIWRGVMVCDSLQFVSIEECFELKRLPRLMGEERLKPPTDWCIKGSTEWWGSLEWDPAYPKNILQPFFIEKKREDRFSQSDECAPERADSQSEGEDSSMSEGEKSSQSDECVKERAGIDGEKTFHSEIVCDNCEMHPIVGKRYRCKDCWEERVVNTEGSIGFDLCEECFNTPSKHSYLVNYHHTQGHTFELIADGGDNPVLEVLIKDRFSQSDECAQERADYSDSQSEGEDSSMSEGENSSQSDVCDNCEMYALVGMRYRCKDCRDWQPSSHARSYF